MDGPSSSNDPMYKPPHLCQKGVNNLYFRCQTINILTQINVAYLGEMTTFHLMLPVHVRLLLRCCFNPASCFCTLQASDDGLPWHTFNTLTWRNRYKNRIQLVRTKQRNAANSVKWVDIQHPFYWFLYYVFYISSRPEDKRRPSDDLMLQKAPLSVDHSVLKHTAAHSWKFQPKAFNYFSPQINLSGHYFDKLHNDLRAHRYV